MSAASVLVDSARLAALRHAVRSDDAARATFERLALLAARTLHTPVAQVNFVSDQAQISVSSVGPDPWAGPRETPLERSFCQHVVVSGAPLLIGDAREHPLVYDNPSTTEAGIVSYAAVPLSLPGGLVLGALCVVDFTPREWGSEEVELLQSLATFVITEIERRGHSRAELLHVTAVLESAEDAIIGVDLDGTVTSWNTGAERIFGYTAEEIQGRPLLLLAPREERRAVGDLLASVLRGDPVGRLEVERTRKDGSSVVASVVWTPVRDLADRVIGATALLRDVTERVRTQEELRRSHTRFRSLVDNVAEIITIIDETGTIRYESPALEPVLGYAPDDLVGKKVFDFIHADDAEQVLGAFTDVLQAPGTRLPYTLRFRHRDGSWRFFEGVATNLVHDPAIGGVVANSRDMTERMRLEEQLRQAQKMEAVGRLAGGVAHDFNNILTAINANSEFLLADLPEGHPSRQEAQEIRDAGKRAARLTQQLLAFSRKQIRRPRVLDLNGSVREMQSMLLRLIGEDVEFVMRLAPELGRVEMDAGQLEQVLLNLAVNARDAMPHGGKLIIETANVAPGTGGREAYPFLPAGTPGVLLMVSDNGEGMSREVQERIFEPFFTTKPQGQGTGLGLSTIYGIVKQSGGHVWVYSEVGRGTTFKIFLPRVDAAPEPQGTAPAAAEPRRSGTIVLAEDEDAVRNATRRILERFGYRVLPAHDGEEALRIAAEHPEPIDLLITDVVMPRMNGRELGGRFTRLRPAARVLFLSGYTDEAIVHHGVLDPGVHFLQKPFGPEELARKVGEVLDSAPP